MLRRARNIKGSSNRTNKETKITRCVQRPQGRHQTSPTPSRVASPIQPGSDGLTGTRSGRRHGRTLRSLDLGGPPRESGPQGPSSLATQPASSHELSACSHRSCQPRSARSDTRARAERPARGRLTIRAGRQMWTHHSGRGCIHPKGGERPERFRQPQCGVGGNAALALNDLVDSPRDIVSVPYSRPRSTYSPIQMSIARRSLPPHPSSAFPLVRDR